MNYTFPSEQIENAFTVHTRLHRMEGGRWYRPIHSNLLKPIEVSETFGMLCEEIYSDRDCNEYASCHFVLDFQTYNN